MGQCCCAGVVEVVEDVSPSMDETKDVGSRTFLSQEPEFGSQDHHSINEDEESTQVSMGRLNFDDEIFNDCSALIFTWLPLKQRVRLERVSRKWKRLMPYSDITSVNLPHPDYLRPLESSMVSEEYMRHFFLGVLSRCGPYLRHLTSTLHTWMDTRGLFGLNQDLADLLVEKAPSLVRLDLNGCALSLRCLPTLTRLDKLEKLWLADVTVTDEEFISEIQDEEAIKTAFSSLIQNLPALKDLHLSSVTERFCPTIHSPSLRYLRMYTSTLTTADIRDLVLHCPNLESFELCCIRAPVDLQLGALGGLHKLRNLILDGSWGSDPLHIGGALRSGDFNAICRGCPLLESLDFHFVRELSSCAELWRLPNLKQLKIREMNGAVRTVVLDDTALSSVARYGVLEEVWLAVANLTDKGLASLASCPNLAMLRITRDRSITDNGVKAILEKCKRLTCLEVCWTSIGDGTLAMVGTNGISLATVDATDTLATDEGLRWLVEGREKRAAEGQDLVQLLVSLSFVEDKFVEGANLQITNDYYHSLYVPYFRFQNQP